MRGHREVGLPENWRAATLLRTIGRATLAEADPIREATFGAMRREDAIVIFGVEVDGLEL